MSLIPIDQTFDDETAALVFRLLREDTIAYELAEMLWSAWNVWDDLIDQDEPTDDGAVSGAFWVAFVGLWRNGFWRAHHEKLMPLLEQGIYDWLDSNELRESRPHAAFALRCGVLAVLVKMAEVIGGLDWGRAASVELRSHVLDDGAEYVQRRTV